MSLSRSALFDDPSAEPLLTIIVPCFNDGECLAGHVASLANQESVPLELLIVDDGSTNNSWDFLQQIAETYPGCSVFYQENQGAGIARNSVIDNARGKYVMFVDADDEIDITEASHAVIHAQESEADLLFTQYALLSPSDGALAPMWRRDLEHYNAASTCQTQSELKDLALRITAYPWIRIIARNLLQDNNIRFGSTPVHNDLQFHWQSICHSKKLAFWDGVVCTHKKHDSGSLSSETGRSRLSVFEALSATYKSLSGHQAFLDRLDLWSELAQALINWNRKRIEPQLLPEFEALANRFMHKPGVVLFTPYFRAASNERQAELDECLIINLACEAISRIVLLIDEHYRPPIADPKLEIVDVDTRPTYAMWARMTQQLDPGSISVLANSDIYFDDTLEEIAAGLSEDRTFIALTRVDQVGNEFVPHPDPHWSQDVWAMRAGVDLPDALLTSLEVPLGVPRCDNKVAYLFFANGWTVKNPMCSVRCTHVHESAQRSYDKLNDANVLGTVAYVHPTDDLQAASELEFDSWAITDQGVSGNQPRKASVRVPDIEISSTELSNKPACVAGKEVVFERDRRFYIYREGEELYSVDRRHSSEPSQMASFDVHASDEQLAPLILAEFIPPLINTNPLVIKTAPNYRTDNHFWQHPCATEEAAFIQHQKMDAGANVHERDKEVHTYLALPWATYIDREAFPEEITFVRTNILSLKALVASYGYTLRLHTVCQHISWSKLAKQFDALQVTDLHLSHCESSMPVVSDAFSFKTHGWPLMAVNIETPSRQSGLQFGKPLSEKTYFASFIGAHMLHYRSDARIRLLEAANMDGGDDVLVELNGVWHFNSLVYDVQIQNKALSSQARLEDEHRTLRYNQVLSDSVFSLCPEGAGPNSLRLWESLAIGSVPVVVADDWVPPTVNGRNLLEDCAIFFGTEDAHKIFPYLRSLPEAEILAMQARGKMVYQAYKQMTAF